MTDLTPDALPSLAGALPVPTYDRTRVVVGIVHIGVGGFHRSHQAMYVDRLLRDGRGDGYGICGVGVLPGDRRMKEVLEAQGRPVHAGREAPGRHDRGTRRRLARALPLRAGRSGGGRRDARAPTTRIVSLTITEGGYAVDPVTGGFDPSVRRCAPTSSRARSPRPPSVW
jgi:mannitol 2-dehydrogenase